MRILIVCAAATLISGQALAADTDRAVSGGGNASPLYDAQGMERKNEPKKPPVRAEKSDKPVGSSAQSGAQENVHNNPLYEDKGLSGANPLNKD